MGRNAKDALGDRIKANYENRTRLSLPRRTYTIIRVDGKAFHTLTAKFKRPFDEELIEAMDNTAQFLCEEIQGARFAYVQSDEISVLLTDFETINTDAWFDGNVQKMASVSASIATVGFNRYFRDCGIVSGDISHHHCTAGTSPRWAMFDSRVFTIPDAVEVSNYFIWRQKDAERNSLQMVARSLYSSKQLEGKKMNQLHDLIHAKDQNWNDYPVRQKRGGLATRTGFEGSFSFIKERERLMEMISRPWLEDETEASEDE